MVMMVVEGIHKIFCIIPIFCGHLSCLIPGAGPDHEFRIGRIKHERVKVRFFFIHFLLVTDKFIILYIFTGQVPRGENILDWGIQVMRLHADRKSILEVN